MVHLEGLADEDHGHVGRDDLVTTDDDEVHVGDRLGHRMALHVPGQGEEGLRTGVQREELVGPGFPVESDPQLAADHGDGERIGAVPVDHARDLPLTAQAAHRTRADGAPNLGCKNDFGHDGISSGGENGVRGRPKGPPANGLPA